MGRDKKEKVPKKLTHYQKGECTGCVYRYKDGFGTSTCDYFLLSGERRKDGKNGECLCKKLGKKKKIGVSLVKS